MLDRVADLVRRDRGRRDRVPAVHRLREVDRLLPRVVVIRERPARRRLHRHVLEAVPVQDLARHLGAGEAIRHLDLHVRGDGFLQPMLDDEAEDQRRDQEDEVEAPAAHRREG